MGVVYANFVAIAQPEEFGQSMQLNKDGEISTLRCYLQVHHSIALTNTISN